MVDAHNPLVNTAWLAEHLSDPDLLIIDVRWSFHEEKGKAVAFDDHEAFRKEHFPGAVYVGMATELADHSHQVPDMILGPDKFSEAMQGLGVSDNSQVIVYDDSGLPLASARLWWALSLYGHDNVRVLDGGLLQWKLEGRPTSTKESPHKAGNFVASFCPEWVARKQDVADAMHDRETDIIDCLPNDLYEGRGTHTWGGRSGHIPSAVNIPAISNIDPALAMTSLDERARKLKERGSFCLADRNDLLDHYTRKGLSSQKDVITYCGRGIAASCGLLTLRYLGFDRSRLYDGSWAEWSADESLPVEIL